MVFVDNEAFKNARQLFSRSQAGQATFFGRVQIKIPKLPKGCRSWARP